MSFKCTRTVFLQPLEPVALEEQHQFTVTIPDATRAGQEVRGYFTPQEWAKAERDDISLGEVRQALSTISGSLFRRRDRPPARTVIAKLFPRHQRAGETLPQREWLRGCGPILEQPGSRSLISHFSILEFGVYARHQNEDLLEAHGSYCRHTSAQNVLTKVNRDSMSGN